MDIQLLRAAALSAALLLPCLAEAAPLSLESALSLAVQRSESARSARAGAASAREASSAAGQLPDPTLRVGIDNIPVTGSDHLRTDRDFMTMKRIGIGQEWLSQEKRAARRAAAAAAASRETVQVQIAIADTRLQTALAYLDAFYAGQALELTSLMEHHAHEEFEAARGRLASASGSAQDVLALAGARGVAEDESAEVRQRQSAALEALQRWVGARPDALVPPASLPLPDEQAYVAAHPVVRAMQQDVEVAERVAAATAAERGPNWSWEVSYGQRTGYSDMVSVGVTIPLPIAPGQRQDRETAAKLAMVEQAEAKLADAMRAATAEYRELASDARRLQQRIERYRSGVVMPAEQRTAAATAGYRSNQTSLVTLFEARHAEVDAESRLLTLQRDLAKAQARLAYTPLDFGGAR